MAIYSVSQVTSYLRDVLERDIFLRDLWVGGEVANLSRPGSGHSYFTLRETAASLRCAMFRTARGAEHLKDGVAIIAHGRVSMYEARGELQLVVDIAQPEGIGELQLRLEELKLKLEREGLFEPSRKRDLPAFPRRVGVATSPSGAVWQDIQTVIARRYPLAELLLAPTPVQGDGAATGIVEALGALRRVRDLDCIILARGGGSLEDLWPFNEESVARAIYSSPVPVVSGVGHQTDLTVADLVADRRAPTPSAAAEMAVPDREELAAGLMAARRSLGAGVSNNLSGGRSAFKEAELVLTRGRPDLDAMRMRVDDLLRAARAHMEQDLQFESERFEGLKDRLGSLSPLDTLRRGYAVVQRGSDDAVVSDAAQVGAGDTVHVTVSRGDFDAEVAQRRTVDGHKARTGVDDKRLQ